MTGRSEFSEDEVALVILPEPEVRAREMTDAETPSAPSKIVKLARKENFTVRVTYARGAWQHATQPKWTIKQCVRVVGRRQGLWFAATWLSDVPADYTPDEIPNENDKWKFNTAHIGGMTGLQGAANLRDFIKGDL